MMLKDCHAGLQDAVELFKVGLHKPAHWASPEERQIKPGIAILGNISEMQQRTQKMHQDLIELISALSDGATSDRSSSVCLSSYAWSGSLEFEKSGIP
jgi:hypothetical protein